MQKRLTQGQSFLHVVEMAGIAPYRSCTGLAFLRTRKLVLRNMLDLFDSRREPLKRLAPYQPRTSEKTGKDPVFSDVVEMAGIEPACNRKLSDDSTAVAEFEV